MNHYININEVFSKKTNYKIHKNEHLKSNNISYYNSNINSRTNYKTIQK